MVLRPAEPPGRLQRLTQRRGFTSGSVLLGYFALALIFFAPRLAAHPESTIIGDRYADPQIFVWSFAWWPHAILHGQNPFYTHAIWAPSGFNLAWATSVPALALVFAPITLAFGPILAYDAASIAVAALAAWTAFLLCRHLTRTLWPSVVGGYLFGFSSYILGGELDHIHTTAVFLLPLAALLVLRYLEGTVTARRFIVQFALIVAVQGYLSTEILFTATCVLSLFLLLAFAVLPAMRPRLSRIVARLISAYVLAAVLEAPFLYYALTGFQSRPPAGAENYVSDALNFVVPTGVSFGGWWSGAIAARFPGNDVEQGAYLGLPTLVIIGWFALGRWRSSPTRLLLLALLLAAVASLGSWLTVDGKRLFALPWLHLAMRPLLDDVMPARFSLYTALAASVIVALWAAERSRRRWIRIALPALAVLAVAPNLSLSAWARTPTVPSLFTTSLYRSCIGRGETVLAFPFGPRGDSLLWQADSDFWFRIAGGYIAPSVPAQFSSPASVQQIAADDIPPKVTVAAIRRFVRLKGVTTIVLDASREPFWRPLLAKIARPQEVGGTVVYRLPGATRTATTCARR